MTTDLSLTLSFHLGHPYCCNGGYGECVICTGPLNRAHYSKKLREYLNSVSTIDLIADCKMPTRVKKGKHGTSYFKTIISLCLILNF